MLKTRPILLKDPNKVAPDRHTHEKYIPDLNPFTYKDMSGLGEVDVNKVAEKKRIPLYPVCWGWNADGRSGNATALELRKPQIAHKSTARNYIACAAGVHHSVLVSDEGILYSFGGGRKKQLGYSTEWSAQKGVINPKGGIQQTFPRSVLPSGKLIFGTDAKVSDVDCGYIFSVARQLHREEGIHTVRGLKETQEALADLLEMYPESREIQMAWAKVRHELFKTYMIASGQLLVWGHGDNGELGLGGYQTFVPKPMMIPKLRNQIMIQVACGRNHVLAIDDQYRLFSWGKGEFGRLGHNDGRDRSSPNRVIFFDRYNVHYIAAGDAHSAVLTTNRKGTTDKTEQLRRIATFGKGSHGRLGNGSVYCAYEPVLVSNWPGSLEKLQWKALACGGGHTLALGYEEVEPTHYNPLSVNTYVAAWGYGVNGQLGTGYEKDHFYPVKVRFPKAVKVVDIAAGKSWSLARCLDGSLYAWGKGLRGQLGLGKPKFSLVPRLVKTFTSFLKLSSKYAHSVSISTSKKIYKTEVTLKKKDRHDDIFSHDIHMGMKQGPMQSMFEFDCCKTAIHPSRAKVRYICKDCNITSICRVCMRICHRGHTIVERIDPSSSKGKKALEKNKISTKKVKVGKGNAASRKKKELARLEAERKKADAGNASASSTKPKMSYLELKRALRGKKSTKELIRVKGGKGGMNREKYAKFMRKLTNAKVPFCKCSMYSDCCRLNASIPEEDEDLLDAEGDSIDLAEKEYEGTLWDMRVERRRNQAAIKIQRQAQWYLGRARIKRLKVDMAELRAEVCSIYYQERILSKVWEKLERARGTFREKRERQEMYYEDILKRKFDYNCALMNAVATSNATMYAIEKFVAGTTLTLPRYRRGQMTKISAPSYAYSVTSLRQLQLDDHPKFRIPLKEFLLMTQNLPREKHRDGKFINQDVYNFTHRYMNDMYVKAWRDDYNFAMAERKAAREAALAEARKQLMAKKFAAQYAVKQAEALMTKVKKHGAGDEIISRPVSREEPRYDSDAEAEKALNEEPVPEEPFDIYGAVPQRHTLIRRRNSIVDPCNLYRRIAEIPLTITRQTMARRRNSLPTNLKYLHVKTVPTRPSMAGVVESLELFELREHSIQEYADAKYALKWESLTEKMKNKRVKRLIQYAWCNPRLPLEMQRILRFSGRRRTIAEPERLAKQAHIMLETRNWYAQAKTKMKVTDKMTARRRSFDMGEHRDDKQGILEVLGYRFEDPFKAPTMSDLNRDSALMENRMIFAKVLKQEDSNRGRVSQADFSGFESREKVQANLEQKALPGTEEAAATMPAAGPKKGSWGASRRPMRGQSETKRGPPPIADKPVIWQEYFSDEGETYYYCPESGKSEWEFPSTENAQVLSQYQDDDGNYYWYNWTTGESEWA